MKHSIEEMTALELDETQLAAVHGGEEKNPWLERETYIEIRQDSLKARDQALDDAWKGLTEKEPLKIVEAAYDWAEAKKTQQWAEENLNYLSRREEAMRQAREAEEREQEERRREEEEDERLLEEAEELLRETETAPSQGGSSSAPPANQDINHETVPSFPTNMVNVPAPHQPEVVIEQTGPATSGGGTQEWPRMY